MTLSPALLAIIQAYQDQLDFEVAASITLDELVIGRMPDQLLIDRASAWAWHGQAELGRIRRRVKDGLVYWDFAREDAALQFSETFGGRRG